MDSAFLSLMVNEMEIKNVVVELNSPSESAKYRRAHHMHLLFT